MLIDRESILDHFSKLHVRGRISEVAFQGAWEAVVRTSDHQLLAVAPPLDGVTPLPEAIGAIGFDLIVKTLRYPTTENDDITITYQRDRVVVTEEDGATARFVTCDPPRVHSYVPSRQTPTLSEANGLVLSLDKTLLGGVPGMVSRLGAKTVWIDVHQEGAKLQIGEDISHNATFSLPLTAKHEHTIRLPADVVRDVFKELDEAAAPRMTLVPDGYVEVRQAARPDRPTGTEGDYRWIMSAQAVEEDRKPWD